MKDFQILRYLKQFKFLIAIGSVLAGFMFYYVASNKLQSYTASTVIEYTNAGATEGLAPDGSMTVQTAVSGVGRLELEILRKKDEAVIRFANAGAGERFCLGELKQKERGRGWRI